MGARIKLIHGRRLFLAIEWRDLEKLIKGDRGKASMKVD